MENYSLSEILEQAVQTEKLGNQFYMEMSRRFDKDSKLRQLFETLAVKEQEHEKTFAELKEGAGDSKVENWEEVSMYLRAIVESEFFLGNNKALPSMDQINDIEGALQYAIGFEKETLLYYHSLRDLIKEKSIMEKLIKEEQSHIVWLSDFRRAINK